MAKLIKPLVVALTVNLLASSAVLAQAELSKAQVKEQVVEACTKAAQKRYGEDSVKYVSTKSKWKNAMGGAMLKMKVKPKAKRVTKYSCVLQQDAKVKFYKA